MLTVNGENAHAVFFCRIKYKVAACDKRFFVCKGKRFFVRESRHGRTKSGKSELLYSTPQAWAFLIAKDEDRRNYRLTANGADELAFVQTHGKGVDVRIDRVAADTAEVSIACAGLSPSNRVDIAVFGRNKGTDWGAPSYVSFARTERP